MSDLMGIGLSALNAYRGALSAIGENVANAETPGFTRRSVRLVPGTSGAADPYHRDQLAFGGVTVAGVTRSWDIFRATEARSAAAGAGRAEARQQWLSAVETALDGSQAGIGSRLTAFFNAGDYLAAAPNDRFARTSFLMALDDAAGSFRTTADALRRTLSGIGTAAQLAVDEVNGKLDALAKVNTTLLVAGEGSTARAELEDERDRLIDFISEKIDVSVTLDKHGAARLALADAPGTLLMGPGENGELGLVAASDGTLALQLTNAGGTSTINPASGSLAGLVDASAVTAARRAALDTLAADFAGEINAWSAAGRDETGNPGQPLLGITAGAATLRGLVSDPAAVPAASASGTANGNLLALEDLRGDGGVERRWDILVTGHAQLLSAARSEHAAASAWRDNSLAALDEVSGISLDREAAELLRYQQAYSAAARIVQAGRDTVDTILKL